MRDPLLDKSFLIFLCCLLVLTFFALQSAASVDVDIAEVPLIHSLSSSPEDGSLFFSTRPLPPGALAQFYDETLTTVIRNQSLPEGWSWLLIRLPEVIRDRVSGFDVCIPHIPGQHWPITMPLSGAIASDLYIQPLPGKMDTQCSHLILHDNPLHSNASPAGHGHSLLTEALKGLWLIELPSP